MGSGCSSKEIAGGSKKARERKRRNKNQLKRLIALGMPESEAGRLNCSEVRRLLSRPAKVQAKYSEAR